MFLKLREKNYFLHKKISCEQNPWSRNKHRRFCMPFWLIIIYLFRPSYSRTGWVSLGLQSLVTESLKIHFATPNFGVFQTNKNKVFMQIHMNILTSPHWEKDSHQPATNRKERYSGSKMCRLVITHCGTRLKNKEYVKRKNVFEVYNIIIC